MNCMQNGLLPIRLPRAGVQAMARAAATARDFTLDLEQLTALSDGEMTPFATDPRQREALLLGLDEVQLTLREAESVSAWQGQDRLCRPWAWPSCMSSVRPRA